MNPPDRPSPFRVAALGDLAATGESEPLGAECADPAPVLREATAGDAELGAHIHLSTIPLQIRCIVLSAMMSSHVASQMGRDTW